MTEKLQYGQLLLRTVLTILLIMLVTPVIWVILGSLKSNTDILNYPFGLPTSFSFHNYISAWELGHFGKYLYNTAYVTFFGLILVVFVGSAAGYALAQISFKGRDLVFYLFLIGLTLPTQTIIIPLFYQLKSLGLVNSLWGVIFSMVGLGIPFGIFLMRNTFRDLPRELRESAYVDGAGEWRTFLSIMLPMAKPGVLALVIFSFMSMWNEYLLPLVILIDPSKFTIAVGLGAFQTEQNTNYSAIFAGSVISMIPIVLVYVLFQRQFIEGVVAGAQKG
ncbi:carbohydrate ABC transporter permease [Paenibacillus roseipurpureus]|uniref:Carbohydrate ABC transporter permease n=1 Tax=Paenibacillus roseopurpureus TaxID=2918901 RepID=A0AA96LU02_9BACL|nr:carbohydrate ABC transporter permease [Paenibacillus sp. MBLB1832]WNR46044.1 carbohydrate ABC transporter permease [Paenibacillus sp. MBLB1832]